MYIREFPQVQLAVDVKTPAGVHSRWAPDEHNSSDNPHGLSYSSTMPGGHEQFSCVLNRKPDVDFPDLAEFSNVDVYTPDCEIVWQGRLQASPRTSGSEVSISPSAVGYQAHLDDDKSARAIILDMDLGHWDGPTVARQIFLATAPIDVDPPSTITDPVGGSPALNVGFQGAWSRIHDCEAVYDSHGIPLGALYFAWKINSNIISTDTNWIWQAYLFDSPNITGGTDTSGTLRAPGPGTGSVVATSSTRKAALVLLEYTVPAGNAGVNYEVFWTYLCVAGNNGIPIHGTPTATGGMGVYASDVISHAISTWAPKLKLNRGGISTIEPTTFAIPQMAFMDPTTASAMIAEALKYHLHDWWVDEGPTFNLASRENHGRDWHARVGPSGLQETGPDVDRMFNKIIVAYQDVTGVNRTVGPTGSGADTIDDSLADLTSSNPVSAAGLTIYPPDIPDIGTSTPAAAIIVGQRELAYQRAQSTAGQAEFEMVIQDSNGVIHPASHVFAGDRVTFTDAHDPVPRRIVRAQYDDDSKVCQVDLDSPAQDLDAVIARLGSVVNL